MWTRPQRWIATWALVLGVGPSGCTPPAGIGDPCLPARPVSTGPGDQCANDGGCFDPHEFYVQTSAVECRTRVCLTYHWDEQADPAGENEFSFCTCRCNGPGDPSTLCQCPAGFVCGADVALGEPGFRGRYCVRAP